MNFVSHNGTLLPVSQPVLTSTNRGFRYGDGIFETMRVSNGRIINDALHFQRLFSSLELLEFKTGSHINPQYLEKSIVELCSKNNCLPSARVRLSFYNGNGHLHEQGEAGFIIEATELVADLPQPGSAVFELGIANGITKYADAYSHLKSSSFLPYSIASRYASSHSFNDCLLLNQHGRIADSTIANVFAIINDKIFTPPISEGAVDGIMRKHIIAALASSGETVIEEPMHPGILESAREIFLTNAIRGITAVSKFRNRSLGYEHSARIFKHCFRTIEK